MGICAGLETITDTTISGILAYPNSCDHYFYAKILGALWIILTFILYQREKDRLVKAEMISILGVSSISIIFLSLIMTLLKVLPSDIFAEIIALASVFIIIWLLKR